MQPTWATKDGRVQLYLGDCLDVLPTLETGSVDAVVTDPPYGIGLTTKTSDYRDSPNYDRGESLRASVLYEDDPITISLLIPQWCEAVSEVCERQLWFPGPAMLFKYPEPRALGVAFTMAGAGRCAWGFQCSSPILFYGSDPYLQSGRGARPNSFKDDQPNREHYDHPCAKPLPWMAWAVKRASLSPETILDPFMGSGTTGVACLRTGRRFIGIEIEPKYFKIAVKRITAELKRHPLLEPAPEIQRSLLDTGNQPGVD